MAYSGITIQGGITIGGNISITQEVAPPTLMLNLDGASYAGSGPWIDTVSARSFTLNNGVTYSAVVGGGSFTFVPGSAQYAQCNSSMSSLTTWTAIAWHYYAGTNTGTAPCILTEVFPSGSNQINYSLGNNLGGANTNLMSGFFNGAWRSTPSGYALPSTGAWYQIVGTYDGTINKLYVNNTLVQSASYSGIPSASTAGIRLMRRWDDADYWGGKLAIVQIYDGAMTAGQVTTNWNANKSRFGL